jgi:hypothetical protein
MAFRNKKLTPYKNTFKYGEEINKKSKSYTIQCGINFLYQNNIFCISYTGHNSIWEKIILKENVDTEYRHWIIITQFLFFNYFFSLFQSNQHLYFPYMCLVFVSKYKCLFNISKKSSTVSTTTSTETRHNTDFWLM